MFKDEILESVADSLYEGHLAGAIKNMENYLALHQHQINSDRLYAIKADYQVMIDYWRKGYKDPQLPQLLLKLMQRMYVLYGNVSTNARVLQSPIMSSLFMKAHLSPRDWSVQVVREQLEMFVSDVALLDLEPPHTTAEKRRELYKKHGQLMSEIFAHILTSDLWTDGQGEAVEQLLLSPTVDSNDQQLIVSAMTLAAIDCFDMAKFRTLVHVYLQSADENVRQRALVGWTFASNFILKESIYPEVQTLVNQVLSDPDHVKEIVELQKQVFFCVSAEEDRKTIEQEIMPDLINNQPNITRDGVLEQDDMKKLNDILHPDEEERTLEKMEAGFYRMIDMQKQGSDVYFGGFSQMKRFPFFNEISNWFAPYYANHPGIADIKKKYGHLKFMQAIIDFGPFCNSDKYSFILSFENVFAQMTPEIRDMLDKGEAMIVQQMSAEEIQKPAYIRRIYLQDMFRFYRLYPGRPEFTNVFDQPSTTSAFIGAPSYINTPIEAHLKEMASFLIKRNRKEDACFLLNNIQDEQYFDYDYYILDAYLDDRYAEDSYQKALELKPGDERALLGLARAFFRRGKYQLALNQYNQLIDIHPDKKSYQLNKAICLTNLHRYEEAEQILFKLNYEHADNMNVARVLAWALTCDGKYEQALHLYDQVLADDNPAETDMLNYAFCLWFAGQIDEAANSFRTYVTTMRPNDGKWRLMNEIMQKEIRLLSEKGISKNEIQMMIDWVDVYDM